VNPIPL